MWTDHERRRGSLGTVRAAVIAGIALLASAAPVLAMQAEQPTAAQSTANGEQIFRFDTFGDEQLWTDVLQMNQVIETSVDPITALAVGLKVDADVLPPGILETADLADPATTV